VTKRNGPLQGVRVLDFCHFLAGPYGAALLADLGADVVKVENPDRPDEARTIGPTYLGDESVYFLSLNWNKRSVGIRLPQGYDVVLDLVRHADVVIDNFKPGVTKTLGIDHERLAAINPRIITCSLSGHGATGPYASYPGYDYTIQAMSGVMSLTGEPDGPPGKAGISYVDHSGGLAAALAVATALFERTRTDQGSHIDLGLLDVQVSMLTYLAAWELNGQFSPGRMSNGSHPSIVPAQNFATRDGFVALFVGNDPMWQRLVEALSDERLHDDEYSTNAGRQRNRGALIGILQEILGAQPTAHWVALCAAHSIPCAPVNSIAEALAEPQVQARALVATAEHPSYGSYRHVRGPFGGGAATTTRGAPLLGEHTAEVLAEIGYSTTDVERLEAEGAVFRHIGNRI